MFTAGIGLAYGAIVNLLSNFRGKKNDEFNHVFAAMTTMPAMGVYAKANKFQWGVLNSMVVAGILAYLKYSYSGKFCGVSPDKQSNRPVLATFASHYKPN